jgi:hypothetical protein
MNLPEKIGYHPTFDTPSPGQLVLQNYLRIAPKTAALVVLFRVSACLSADRIARKERDR